MLEFVGIAILLAFVGISIALHELGHMIPAKKFGVRVPEYAIGFGPTIFEWTRGETTYRIRLLPVGGFIRMVGMYLPERADGKRVGGKFARIIEQAREMAAEEMQPGDEKRTFTSLSVPKRLVIMIAGPFMNLVIAFVLFGVMFSAIGIPQPGQAISNVYRCVPTYEDQQGKGTLAGCGSAGFTTAYLLGLREGDMLVELNGQSVTTFEKLREVLDTMQKGDSVSLTVRGTDGELRSGTAPLAMITMPKFDDKGNRTGEETSFTFLGVSRGLDLVTQPLTTVPAEMWGMVQQSVSSLMSFPARLLELANVLVSGGERAADGPVSVVGVSRLSGEIAASDQELEMKALQITSLAASLNLFLFIFNLLPFLPLDGGHAAGATWEGIRRTWNRLRSRPDRGPFDTARLLPLTSIVTFFLIAAGAIVIIADIFKPISLGL